MKNSVEKQVVKGLQGFPDFPAPQELKEAAQRAIFADHNQYAITWGSKPLRDALVWKTQRDYGVTWDPETQLTVVCGSTEGMIATLLATISWAAGAPQPWAAVAGVQ